MTHRQQWTRPYYGVSHLGNPSDGWWATVTDHNSFADVSLWFPGCQFSPKEQQHETMAEARTAGESWIATQGNSRG